MFNLEKTIAEWRMQMLAAGIKIPVPLEELESHLRDEIERQMKSGLGEKEAFQAAVQKIGQVSDLEREFKKVRAPMGMQTIIKLAGIICVAIALFCQIFFFLSFNFLLGHGLPLMTRVLAMTVLAATVASIVLSWRYNHKFLPTIRNQLLRRAVGIACYGGCLLWIRFGTFHFPPGDWNLRSIWLPLFVFELEWTVMAILGGIGHGLEKAASKESEPVDLLAGQS